MTDAPTDAGLQGERTQLSWERSAIGFLAGGAIPLLRVEGPLGGARPVLAATGVALAILVVWLGRRRAKHVTAGPDSVPAPRTEVFAIGVATTGFAALIIAVFTFFP